MAGIERDRIKIANSQEVRRIEEREERSKQRTPKGGDQKRGGSSISEGEGEKERERLERAVCRRCPLAGCLRGRQPSANDCRGLGVHQQDHQYTRTSCNTCVALSFSGSRDKQLQTAIEYHGRAVEMACSSGGFSLFLFPNPAIPSSCLSPFHSPPYVKAAVCGCHGCSFWTEIGFVWHKELERGRGGETDERNG